MLDIHTHRPDSDPAEALLSADPAEEPDAPSRPFSAGVHPWRSDRWASSDVRERLRLWAANPLCAAIGECGLDRRRGPALAVQLAAFRAQAELAAELEKPLIIHNVGCDAEVIALRREIAPIEGAPWIVHGFRGKPEQARQLLAHGLHISLGCRFNPAAAAAIPIERLHLETDEAEPEAIRAVVAAVASARGATPEQLLAELASTERPLGR